MMTDREFFEAVVKANLGEEMTEKAEACIARIDHTNELRKASVAKKSAAKEAERAPQRDALAACIGEEAKTATMLIAEAGLDLKPQSVSALLKPLVEAGVVGKTEVKVKGKGKQVGYVRL